MKKKVLQIFGCLIGGGMIAFCANTLDTPLGIALFTIGVILLTTSANKL